MINQLEDLKQRLEEKLNANDNGIQFLVLNPNAFGIEKGELTARLYNLNVIANECFDRYDVEKVVAEIMAEEGVLVYVSTNGVFIARERKVYCASPTYHKLYCNDGMVWEYDECRTAVYADGTFSYYIKDEDGKLFLCHYSNRDYKKELTPLLAQKRERQESYVQRAVKEITDDWLVKYPLLKNLMKGDSEKLIFATAAEFCYCDLDFLARLVEEILQEHNQGKSVIVRGIYPPRNRGGYPRNKKCFTLSCMAIYTQEAMCNFRKAFLPQFSSSRRHDGRTGESKVEFRCKE